MWSDRRLRALLGFSWLAGCWVVPKGLAAPYAAEHGGGPQPSVGILLAADPIGVLDRLAVLSRFVSTRRPGPRDRAALRSLTGVPLVAVLVRPRASPIAFALWALCGVLSSYQVLVVAEFVAHRAGRAARPGDRDRSVRLCMAVQGIGLLAGGALAAGIGTAPAIAVAGVAGAVLSVMVTLSWGRAAEPYRQTAAEWRR